MTAVPVTSLREMRVTYHPDRTTERVRLGSPRVLAALLIPLMSIEVVEVFRAVYITTKHDVIATVELGRGTIDSTTAAPRDVVRGALLSNAAGVILAHNHPSGDPAPSPDDIALTTRITAAMEMFDIDVVDHLIIGDGRYFSFREAHLIN